MKEDEEEDGEGRRSRVGVGEVLGGEEEEREEGLRNPFTVTLFTEPS